jgi:hypothetical protein
MKADEYQYQSSIFFIFNGYHRNILCYDSINTPCHLDTDNYDNNITMCTELCR